MAYGKCVELSKLKSVPKYLVVNLKPNRKQRRTLASLKRRGLIKEEPEVVKGA